MRMWFLVRQTSRLEWILSLGGTIPGLLLSTTTDLWAVGSKLQSIVTLSVGEVEYVGLTDMIFEVKYLRELARGLGFGQTESTLIWEDNRATILTTEAECSVGRTLKHVDVKFRFVTESVRNIELRVIYIPTNLNFTDIMTKTLVPKNHKEGVDLIVNTKDTYRIVTDRREMTDKEYEVSYFIIQDGDSDGLC